MKNREITLWTIIIALIGGIVLYISINKNETTLISKTDSTTNTSTTAQPFAKTKQTLPKPVSTIPSFTLSELSQHKNIASCWTVINGKIYDITPFLSSHPAGVSAIMKGCGIDATVIFGRVGAHDISLLTNAFVGNLK